MCVCVCVCVRTLKECARVCYVCDWRMYLRVTEVSVDVWCVSKSLMCICAVCTGVWGSSVCVRVRTYVSGRVQSTRVRCVYVSECGRSESVYMGVCEYVCVWGGVRARVCECARVCVCVCARVCVCACVRVYSKCE